MSKRQKADGHAERVRVSAAAACPTWDKQRQAERFVSEGMLHKLDAIQKD